MKILIRIDGNGLRGWHLDLLERLSTLDDMSPAVEFSPGGDGQAVMRLLRLEGWLRGQPARAPSQPVPRTAFDRWRTQDGHSTDLTLDLSSSPSEASDACWRLTFDGQGGEVALVAATLAGVTPTAELRDGRSVIAAARLGTDRVDAVQAKLDDMLERTVTLLLTAIRGGRPGVPQLPDASPPPDAPRSINGALLGRMAKGIVRGAVGGVYRRLYRAPHWRVGWRKVTGPDLFDLQRHPERGWNDLPDDGSRYYADPFPIVRNGRVTLFVEDFIHDAGRAVISAVDFTDQGPDGIPEPVLDLPEHLSYPFVFERDGEFWMVPECCASGRIDLFRATAFPRGWVREATLVRDVVASDATLVEHEGSWWMFATVQDGGGFSDALHLWSAPDFRGPWTPHKDNPVLIDIASARPAGRMVERGGALLRPVQDCRLGYGKALALARVLRLDAGGFEQQVEAIVEAGGPHWSGRRIHSLNEAGGLEFIDGSRDVRRNVLPRR